MNIFYKYFLIIILIFSYQTIKTETNNTTEQLFLKAGLVDVQTIDSTIQVDLVNSNKSNNFFGENFYSGLQKAYLQKAVAQKLAKAQKILKKKNPNYSLMIMDSARPNSVSHKMYKKMKGTKFEKFVANPTKGSMHNYGAAVDITIVDEEGKRIDMGFIPFYKGKTRVAISYFFEKILTKISDKEKANRKLLKDVMLEAGFYPLSYEWWHFNGFQKKYIRKHYNMIM